MGIKEKIQRHRGGLLENTVMLYILQFSNMALGLVTQGYQMRVLGVELIGVLGAAQYATNFFQILIDFGFIYSATAKVSRFREDKNVLNKMRKERAINRAFAKITQVSTLLSTFLSSRKRETFAVAE